MTYRTIDSLLRPRAICTRENLMLALMRTPVDTATRWKLSQRVGGKLLITSRCQSILSNYLLSNELIAWARLREEQRLSLDLNIGMAVTIDLRSSNIHPPNKIDVAERLARWPLAKVYKLPKVSPVVQSLVRYF